MPSDQFYGGAGVDLLYPSQMMSGNPFSEQDWASVRHTHSIPSVIALVVVVAVVVMEGRYNIDAGTSPRPGLRDTVLHPGDPATH